MISVLTWKRQSEHYSVSLLPLVFVYAIERCLGTGFGDVLIYRPQLKFCLKNTCIPQGFYRLKKFRQERSRVVKFDLFSGTRLIFSLSTELFFCSKVFNLRTGQLVVPEDKIVSQVTPQRSWILSSSRNNWWAQIPAIWRLFNFVHRAPPNPD